MTHQSRLLRLMVLLVWLMSITSILAQDTPTETPTEMPVEVVTDIPTEAPTEVVPETPTDTPTEIPTEVPTQETPTEAVPTAEIPAPTQAPVEPFIPLPSVSIQTGLTPEPEMTLTVRELFQDEANQAVLPADWVLPIGWTLQAAADGGSLHIDAALAGATSHVFLSSIYTDVAAMGYFTFVDQAGTALVTVRDSADGRYQAALDASGQVTLSKQDNQGALTVLATAFTPLQAGAHGVQLSAIGDVLRVSIDNVEVIALQDTLPLLTGGVSIGAAFSANEGLSGTIILDNVFVWLTVPSPDLPTPVPTATPQLPPISNPPTTGKSTIPRTAPRIFGVMSSSNDDFASRLTVAAIPYTHNGDTIGNSKEGSEPTPTCGFNITNTAWYAFTPPAGGPASETFTITSFGSSFDTMLAVYTDSNGGAANLADLTPVAGGCSDDIAGSLQAQISLTLSDSATYYIQLGGYNGSVGNFKFAILRPVDALIPAAPAISLIAASAPSAPIANGAPIDVLNPVLAWSATGGVVPYSYDIEISTTTSFSSPIADTTLEPQRYYRPSLPSPTAPTGQVYYWHVRARNILGQFSLWSATYSFRIDTISPNPPGLISPAVNSISNTFRPTFSWSPIADATSYFLHVASNFSCATTVQTKTSSTTTTKLDADLPQGEYWFCVYATDAAGNGNEIDGDGIYGEKRHFFVNASSSPANGTLFTPTGGATSTPVTLKWIGLPNSTYQVEVATDSSFSGYLIPPFNVTGLTTTIPNVGFGEYYWRVNSGSSLPQNLAWKFTVSPPVPLAPVINPNAVVRNAGFTNDTMPLLDWNVPTNWVTLPLGQSLYYQLELSTNSGFTALVDPRVNVFGNTDYEWVNTTLDSGTTYYWHVRAVTNLGVIGQYSPTYSFTVDTYSPAPPTTLIAPLDNAVLSAARPTFSWNKVSDASSYLVDIATDTSFASQIDGSPFPATTTSLVLPVSLAQDDVDVLYWRVYSKDAAGNVGIGGAHRVLRIDYALTPVEGYTQALIGTAEEAPVKFTWAAVPGVTGTPYSVKIYPSAGLFTPLEQSGNIAGTTWTSPALLDGEYWWTLTVNDIVLGPLGTSQAHRFVVSLPLPGAPLAPFTITGGTPTKDKTPKFNWGNPTLNPGSVVDYELQISTVNSFTSQVAGSPYIVTTSPFEITTALPDTPGQMYYWRVRARALLGAGGPFTTPQAFTLDTTPPDAPLSLTAPANLAVLSVAKPAFSWPGTTGNKYRIEIATDNAFGNIILSPTTSTPGYTLAAPLQQGVYYWQVWALDAAGNESLSAVGPHSFTVDYRTAPLVNAFSHTATTANVVFSWTLVPGVGYSIELDTDLNGTANNTYGPFTTGSSTITGLAQGDYQYRLVTTSLGTSDWRPFFVAPLIPGAPAAPFTITGGTPTSDTTPTFNWGKPTLYPDNVTGYKLEIATTSNFTISQIAGSPFDVAASPTPTYTLLSALPATTGQVYYWRVQAKMQFNKVGPYSPTQSFTLDTAAPGNVTTLTAPADAAKISVVRPTFTWSAPTGGAASYIFELTQDNTDFSPLVLADLPTTPSYTIPEGYLQQGTYYWRVRSRDAAANSSPSYSPVRSFVVNYSTTPTANAVMPMAAPAHFTFKWTAVPGVTGNPLRLEIDNDNSFSSVLRRSPALSAATTSYATSMPFSVGGSTPLPFGTYYWRILVNGQSALSGTLVQSFTISPLAPPAPVLSTATPTASTADPSPTFEWNAVTSPDAAATVTGYEFQLATVNTFAPASLVGGTSINLGAVTSYTWMPELPATSGTTYYARIRAVTNLGLASAWSGVRSFILDTDVPVIAPTLIAPANGASVTTQKPTFQWGAVTGAARYEMRYGTQPNLSAVTPVVSITLTHVPAGNLLFTNYYWEVRAIDAAGNIGPWSAQRVVKVTSAVGVAPTLWGYTSTTPTLSWTPLYWATGYVVEVSRTSTFNVAAGDIVWQSGLITATDTPSISVGTGLANGTYYWRVRGKKPDPYNLGNTGFGPYSAVNSFSVEVP